MKFHKNYLDFSGEKLIKYGLTIEDAYLLEWIKVFSLSPDSKKMLIGNKSLIWTNYTKILEDLKLLFKNRKTIQRKTDEMVKKNILIKFFDKKEHMIYLGLSDNYEDLLYWNNEDSSTTTSDEQIKTDDIIVPKPKKQIPEEIEKDFEWFWNTYDKKTGRDSCYTKFTKLKKDDIAKIKETLPEYIKNTPDKKYRKNPTTYLNNKCWNDEVIETKVTPVNPMKTVGINYSPARRIFTDEDDD